MNLKTQIRNKVKEVARNIFQTNKYSGLLTSKRTLCILSKQTCLVPTRAQNDLLDNHLYVADVHEANKEVDDGLKAHSGVYDNENNSCYIYMSNLTNENIEIQPNQGMAVLDSLVQEPTDAHRTHDKKIDKRLDTIRFPARVEKKNKGAHDLILEMSLGELSESEKKLKRLSIII